MDSEYKKKILFLALDYYKDATVAFLKQCKTAEGGFPLSNLMENRINYEINITENLKIVIAQASSIDMGGSWAPEFKRILTVSLISLKGSINDTERMYTALFGGKLITNDVAHIGINDILEAIEQLLKEIS